MTNKLFWPILIMLCVSLASCIKTEALNTEADIESCTVEGNILIADPKIENTRVTLTIDPTLDIPSVISKIAIDFTLTPGATIDPPSGTIRDFTEPQTYTVTSQDGEWKKEYTISCIVTGIGAEYNFEHYRFFTDSKTEKELYYEFYEVAEGGGVQDIWASGNPGYKIVAAGKTPEDYPTVSSPNGLIGRCLKLETRSTGAVGALLKMPLAAGNLFMGSYSGSLNALTATHFGVPFNFIPTGLTGYYTYKAGENYTDRSGAIVPGKKDNFDIYGILYETDDKVKYLDGTNSLTSPNLIAIARISDEEKKETDSWTHFYLPFNVLPGKEIDMEKLADNKYNVSIVFSSSIDGATFSGAVGSTLMIDEVELIQLEK